MSFREQLDAKYAEDEALQKEYADVSTRMGTMRVEIENLRSEVAKEEGLLKALDWELSPGFFEQFLRLFTSTDIRDCPELAKLFEVDAYGHYGAYLYQKSPEYVVDGRAPDEGWIELRFDDGDIALRFDVSQELMQQFIKEWGLKVIAPSLENELEMAHQKVGEVTKALEFVKELNE
jgi:hypothetical protein